MQMTRILALTGVLALAAVRPGAAADLGAGSKDVYYAAPTTYWQGPYAGVVMGIGGAGATIEDSTRDNPNVGNTSFTAGVLIGYNFRSGPWVGGFEADISGMDVSKTEFIQGYGDIGVTSNITGSLRLRAGYAWDRVLLYATGGLGAAEWEIKSPVSGKSGGVLVAPSFGLGAEIALSPQWSLRGEIIHFGFGTPEMEVSGHKQDVSFGANAVRLGLTRQF